MLSRKPRILTPFLVSDWDVIELSSSRTIYANDLGQVSGSPALPQIPQVFEEFMKISTEAGRLAFLKRLPPELLDAFKVYAQLVLDDLLKLRSQPQPHNLSETATATTAAELTYEDFATSLGVSLE